ncbi:MAG: hypothetical protein Sapg2KO_23010 [Saprospiraceae bacterium]
MISQHRKAFNEQFTQEKYQALLDDLNQTFDYEPPFRIGETPVFIPNSFKERLLEACEEIMAVINRPDFKELTQDAFIDPEILVPNESAHSKFVQLDFGVCLDENGDPIPKLIELQGFPSLFFFQELLIRLYRKHFDLPAGSTIHPNGMSTEEFIELLRSEIVGDTDPKQVVLLEVTPDLQATAIDFYAARALLGIKILCITDLKKRGKTLYYLDESGQEVIIKRIFNRIIFDELYQRKDIPREFHFTEEVDVEWVGHPNWFFRISKYAMPLFDSQYAPKCYHLDKLEKLPEDLENYVLKPFYSFAGTGVQIHVTPEIIDGLKDRSNYLLQEKVQYHPIVETMDVPTKCEIRMMMIHNEKTNKTEIISNLMRLSKGEMIGVKYNKNKTWIGASVGLFES